MCTLNRRIVKIETSIEPFITKENRNKDQATVLQWQAIIGILQNLLTGIIAAIKKLNRSNKLKL